MTPTKHSTLHFLAEVIKVIYIGIINPLLCEIT